MSGSLAAEQPAPSRPRLLLYAAFDASQASNAPRVRVRMLSRALARHAEVTLVSGARFRRAALVARLIARGLGRFDAVYVESATTSAMPWDLALVAAARARRVPVGIYFRDAYQRFRDLYPIPGWRRRLADAAWRLSTAILSGLATVRFTPSRGLAAALGIRDAVLVPPGTDPDTPMLGPGRTPIVAYTGALSAPVGFARLVEAVRQVRQELPEVTLLALGPAGDHDRLPDFVEVRHAPRDLMTEALAPVAVCVIPHPVNAYTNLTWALKLSDYLAWGKPIVATATAETRAVLEGTGAGLLVGDSSADLAEGLLRVLRDPTLAADLAARARALAEDPQMTWDSRAQTILASLTRKSR